VKKKAEELVEDPVATDALSAGPVGLLSSVLIALMGSAILYNLVWRQNGHDFARTGAEQSYVEIVAGEANVKLSEPAARVSVKKGSKRDPLLAAIQAELAALGYFDGPADGMAGAETRAAVMAYQRKKGLRQTGRPSQRLLDHIRFNQELLSASEFTGALSAPAGDDEVRRLQKGLAALGYRPGAFDGHLGAQTREAIRQFERDRAWPITGAISSALIAELSDIGAFAETAAP
jgi:peptidoglycan hydrolase-like protein with peptidoglycan-binding domain